MTYKGSGLFIRNFDGIDDAEFNPAINSALEVISWEYGVETISKRFLFDLVEPLKR